MIRHRRGNAAAGIMLLLGGIAVSISVTQPWVKVSGPSIGLGDNGVNIGLTPSQGMPVGDDIRFVVAVCGITVAVLAALLIATTMPGLGIVWRTFALVVAAIPAFVAAEMWAVIGRLDFSQSQEQTTKGQIADAVRGGLEALGLVKMEPAPGLLILTGGLVAVLIGILLPARRSQEWVGPPPQWGPPQHQARGPFLGPQISPTGWDSPPSVAPYQQIGHKRSGAPVAVGITVGIGVVVVLGLVAMFLL